jgi:hypothetical protein
MPVNPQVLKMISDPTGGRLGDIGETLARNRQMTIENERADEEAKRKSEKHNFEMTDLGMKTMGYYSDAVMKSYEPNMSDEEKYAIQKNVWDTLTDVEKGMVPETFQSDEELLRGQVKSDAWSRRHHPELYEVNEKDLNKWQTELLMIREKNENPDSWTDTKQQQLDALQRQTLLPVSMGRPSKTEDIFSKESLKVLKKNGDVLANNIENENAYAQDLAAEKRKLMEERELLVRQKKADRLLSDAEATQLAHDNLSKHLQESDVLFELTGFANPLGKKYIYAPNRNKGDETEEPEETTVSQPSDLKEGEEGVFGEYMYRRENGKLQRKKVE